MKNKSIFGICLEVSDLLEEKNRKYGNANLTKHGHLGVLTHLSDKLARLETLTKDNLYPESIEDTYKDIAGYAVMALKLMRAGEI